MAVAEGKGKTQFEAETQAKSKLTREASRPKYKKHRLGHVTVRSWQRASGEWVATAQGDIKPITATAPRSGRSRRKK